MHLDEIMLSLGFGVVQLCTILSLSLSLFAEGYLSAGIFYLMPEIGCDFNLHFDQVVFCYISFVTGLCAGSIFLAPSSDIIGRKSSIVLACNTCFAASLFASAAPLLLVLEICLFFMGIGVACISAGCRIIMFEILHMQNRGTCMGSLDIFTNLGVFTAIGHLGWGKTSGELSVTCWRLIFVVGAMLCLIGAVAISIGPFSPRQMLAHNRFVSFHGVLKRFYAVNRRDHESNFADNIDFRPRRFRYTEGELFLWPDSNRITFCLNRLVFYTIECFKCPFTLETIKLIFIYAVLFDGTIVVTNIVAHRIRGSANGFTNPGLVLDEKLARIVCFPPASSPYLIDLLLVSVILLVSILLPFVLDRLSRPNVLSFASFGMAFTSLLLAFNIHPLLDLVMACTLVAFHAIASQTLKIISLETFPTKFRSTGYGILKGVSRLSLLGILFVRGVKTYAIFAYFPAAVLCVAFLSMALTNQNKKPLLE